MGFYGDITNTSHTHFQFDKIFENRADMDRAVQSGTDGIFTGRFVLVKYDPQSKFFIGDMLLGYLSGETAYASAVHGYGSTISYANPFYAVRFDVVSQKSANNWDKYYTYNDYFYWKLPAASYYSAEETYYQAVMNYPASGNNLAISLPSDANIVSLNTIMRVRDVNTGEPTGTFIQCYKKNGQSNDDVYGHLAQWKPILTNGNYPSYITNYQIDQATYKEEFDVRGYDATVWEKVYSEGVGRFVMVARLSGMMPALELYPDPPSNEAKAPYIDSKSTDALYRIHMPSQWGFRIKEADYHYDENNNKVYEKSDQLVVQPYYTYDDNNHLTSTNNLEIQADIYFNKNGNDIGFNQIDTDTIDQITIEPTGSSGKHYWDSEGNEVTLDTYELGIHLPMLGNMVANGYNLIYGYDEESELNPKPRLTDIEWVDASHTSEEKYNGINGRKNHDLNTLAGTLNTFHDRLGQIVYHLEAMPAPSTIPGLSFDYIYEVGGQLYRKGIKYRKITIDDDIYLVDRNVTSSNFSSKTLYTYSGDDIQGKPIYTQATTFNSNTTYYYKDKWCKYDEDIAASSATFTTNKYYERRGSSPNYTYVRSTDTEYNSEKTYYLKNINQSRFTQIDLTNYQAGSFYYLEGENYICDRHTPDPYDANRTYYTITRPNNSPTNPKAFNNGYEPGIYYRLDPDTQAYIREDAEMPDPLDNRPFYDVTNTSRVAASSRQRILYLPNHFYCEKKSDPGEIFLAEWATLTQEQYRDYYFYAATFSDTPKYGKDADGNIIEYYEQINIVDVSEILMIPSPGVTYYYISQDEKMFIPYDKLDRYISDAYTVGRIYYSFPTAPQQYSIDALYLPGRYYIYDGNTGNYSKANEKKLSSYPANTAFYHLTSQYVSVVRNPFYLQNKYYWERSSNVFELDDSLTMKQNRTYFVETGFYVDHDETNQCPRGYKWSELSAWIPPSITLVAREEEFALVPMDAAYNGDPAPMSINGALLYLHQSYDPLNVETRDTTTFRGALNTINDLLYQISKLEPGKICYVNHFGQITSSDISYEQLRQLIH